MRLLLAAAAALTGCFVPQSNGVAGPLAVTRTDCAGSSTVAGATHFRLRVFAGPDVESALVFGAADPLPSTLAASAGPARRAVLEAFAGDPSNGGKAIAIARSAVQDVAAGTAPTWTLRLRPVEAFTPACAMTEPRAGHAAVVLADGQLWLAGGVGAAGTPLATTEVFDGATFTATAPMGVSGVTLPRAFGTATLLQNGQVVLWGGEAAVAPPSAVVLVYDRAADAFGAVRARVSPPNIARSRHFAARVGADVFVLGGDTDAIERLSSSDFIATVDGALPDARSAAAVAMLDARTVVIAGGTATGQPSARVDLLRLFTPRSVTTATLAHARRGAVAARVGSGVLVAGGEDATGPLNSTEWISGASKVTAGPPLAPRAEACAVTLEDGRALVVGGRSGATPVAAAELVDPGLAANSVAFPGAARVNATCTLLPDGSVLVAGGTSATGALADAWFFTPRQ